MRFNGFASLLRISGQLRIALILVGCTIWAGGAAVEVQHTDLQRVTLYARVKYGTNGYGRSAFDFKHGIRSDHKDWLQKARNRYHLLYGNTAVNGETDWLAVAEGNDSRVKDIGEVEWADLCCATLLPTPPRGVGAIRMPSNGESFEVSSDQRATKAVLGHMYVLHVKNREADFYVMFRVEELNAGDHCTISWKIMPSPE